MITVVPSEEAIDEASIHNRLQLDEAEEEEQVKTSFLPSAFRGGCVSMAHILCNNSVCTKSEITSFCLHLWVLRTSYNQLPLDFMTSSLP
jgi:hypothetical protein